MIGKVKREWIDELEDWFDGGEEIPDEWESIIDEVRGRTDEVEEIVDGKPAWMRPRWSELIEISCWRLHEAEKCRQTTH